MKKEKIICMEMDDASGRDKHNNRWAKLEDWIYFYNFLKEVNAFVTIAIEPQEASKEVMKFLAGHRERFLPTVHGTTKYRHYGGIKTEKELREQWKWTVKKVQEYGFDMGLDSNGIFIPPMHMISDTSIDVLNSYGVEVIGNGINNFPLGSKEIRNSRGEIVYFLAKGVEPYTLYRNVYFYKRFRPWALKAGYSNQKQIMDLINNIMPTSGRSKYIDRDYNKYLSMCVKDFKEKCLEGNASFYAHEINLCSERPFMQILEKIAQEGLFDDVRFVDAKELVKNELINKPIQTREQIKQSVR